MFFHSLYNWFMHYSFHFENDWDRGVVLFLLIDLLIFSVIHIGKSIKTHYKVMEHIVDQFNEFLSKRDEIIKNIRKSYAFEKVRGNYFNILFLKRLGNNDRTKEQIELAQKDLINFGLDEQIARDDGKLSQFLIDYNQDKYEIIVDQKAKKFHFIRKEQKSE